MLNKLKLVNDGFYNISKHTYQPFNLFSYIEKGLTRQNIKYLNQIYDARGDAGSVMSKKCVKLVKIERE